MAVSRNHDDSDRELNRLLGEARRPDPTADQLARLHGEWLSRRRVRRLSGRWVAVAATMLLLISGAILWRSMDRRLQDEPLAKESRDAAPPVHEKPANHYEIIAAAPTPYQAVQLRAWELTSQKRASPPSRSLADQQRDRERIEILADELIAALTADAAAEIDDRLPAAPPLREHLERTAGAILQTAKADRREGAARLLAHIATRRSLPMLFKVANDEALHATAVEAIARLAEVPELARLATIERESTLRLRLLGELLHRGTRESIAIYLRFVDEPLSREEAIAAVAASPAPPTYLLASFLDANQSSLRRAAALALANSNDRQAEGYLANALANPSARQDVIAGLLLSRTPQAMSVLERARQSLYLVAAVRATEHQMQSQINSN